MFFSAAYRALQKNPWHLTVVDSPEVKQVLHFTEEQPKAIATIVEVKDGKTHYLEITNFFEVFTGTSKPDSI